VGKAIREAKGGKVEFRAEKAGIVHAKLGKASFAPEKLTENFNNPGGPGHEAQAGHRQGRLPQGRGHLATMSPGIKIDTPRSSPSPVSEVGQGVVGTAGAASHSRPAPSAD
jgi:large subunit ribosomal protein L1